MKKLCLYGTPYPEVKSYHDMIDAAASLGVGAVECLNIYEFSTPDLEVAKRLREYADSKGVIFPCFSVFASFAFEEKKALFDYAEIAKILGSPYLHHTVIGEAFDPSKVVPRADELFEKSIQAIREIYDYADAIGIKAIYEEQGYIFNGVKGIGRLLDEVARPVGIVADFGNIYQSGDDLFDYINAFGARALHAHIKDVIITDENVNGKGLATLTGKYMYSAPFGEGRVKTKDAIALLKGKGYDGYYGLEFGMKDAPSMAKAIETISDML